MGDFFRGCSAAGLVLLLVGTVFLSGCDSAEDRAAAHYESGVKLVAEGEPLKGALEFRNALKLNEDFVAALFALAQVEEGQGKFDTAASMYVSVAERSADHVEARVRLAYILLAAGQLADALNYAEEAFAIADDDPAVLVVKAAVALKLDNRGDAVRLSEAALGIDPNNADALMVLASERLIAADPKRALVFLDRALDKSERNVAIQLLRLAALDKMGDASAVEGVLIRLTELYPETSAFRTTLVTWYLSKGRKDEGEATLRHYAATHPAEVGASLDLVTFLNSERGAAAASRELEALINRGGGVFAYRLALAELRFAEGQRLKAVDLLRSLVADTSEGADQNKARVQLARMVAEMNDSAEAERLVDEVLTADGKNVDALAVRASLQLSSGRITDSISDLVAAINEAPEATALLALLGEAYERSGAVELAEEQLVKVVQLEGQPEAALRLANFLLRYGKLEQAERLLEELPVPARTDRRVLTLLAQLKLKRQDWIGAQGIAEALHTLDATADDPVAQGIRAAALSGLGRHDESIAILEGALSGPADRQDELRALVRAYLLAGRYEAAEELLKSAIENDSTQVQPHILLGFVYMVLDKKDLATASFERAIEADQDNAAGYVALAQFNVVLGNLDQAEATARAGLERQGDNSALRLLLASILELTNQYEAAIAEYERVLAMDPRSTIAANNLASLLSEHRTDPKSLETAYGIALRFRNSEVPHFLDTLGWIYHLRGDHVNALKLLKTAADRLPEVGPVQYHLGITLKELEQNELAIASLEKAIALAGNDGARYADEARSALVELRTQTLPERASN